MTMDPSKWISFESLSSQSKEKINQRYAHLQFDKCQFQEKESGVYVRQENSVKVEKLLDPVRNTTS